MVAGGRKICPEQIFALAPKGRLRDEPSTKFARSKLERVLFTRRNDVDYAVRCAPRSPP